MNESWIRPHKNGSLLLLYIQPGASKSEVAGLHGDRLKIRIKAPPVEGEANRELISFISSELGISSSKVHLVRGEASRQKDILIEGSEAEKIKALFKRAS